MEVIVNRKKRKVDGEKIFSIVASLAIVAALVVGVISIVRATSNSKKQNYIDLNIANNSTEKDTQVPTRIEPVTTAPSASEPATDTPTLPAAQVQDETPVQVNAPVFSFNDGSSLVWPVDGDVILGYNMDNTIYFPTLDQYKCNPAIIISAEVGTDVKSAAPGLVENIYEDPILGTSMVISVGDGYKITYGQLQEPAVGISDTVEAGTVIGKIAKPTRYFTEEGSNLYFELDNGDTPVDPLTHLIDK